MSTRSIFNASKRHTYQVVKQALITVENRLIWVLPGVEYKREQMKGVEQFGAFSNSGLMANIPYRSKLLPHWEMIKRLRRERQTWAEIAHYLTEQCNCPTTFQAVHIFYKRKAKGSVPLGFEVAEVAPEISRASGTKPPPRTAAGTSPAAPGTNAESLFDEPQERQWTKPKFNTDF